MGSIPVANPVPPRKFRFSRRAALVALALLVFVAAIAVLIAFAWPESPTEPAYEWVSLAQVEDLPLGEPVVVREHRLYLVDLGNAEVLALWRRDPHLGCTVPWAA